MKPVCMMIKKAEGMGIPGLVEITANQDRFISTIESESTVVKLLNYFKMPLTF